ncbi:hypothetical protein FQN54_006970 [Arachnomyces sp. PD_36]|nr:hypothetical protein FQN54_006970 [Arachnomyces sp. PD_36]
MKWLNALWIPALLAAGVLGEEVELDQSEANRQKCAGMYSRKSWGGSTEPFILAKFSKSVARKDEEDPLLSLVIFEWEDVDLIGRVPDGEEVDEDGYEVPRKTICDEASVEANLCPEEDLGSFILHQNASSESRNRMVTTTIHLNQPEAINYAVSETGFYCVSTYAYSGQDYKAIVSFNNAYGKLPATQIAKLPFYGALTIVYAVIGAFWAFLYVQNRHDILPVQNYITAIIVFLIVEQLMTWGFYNYQNIHGSNGLAKALMVLVAILNAGRNSFSFFLLLIVCMGYGVVKPSLGRTMVYVRILAATHFVFGVIYAIASLSITPDNIGPLLLLIILPLAATLTAFYVWTLNSLNGTMKDLVERKQRVKAMMYKKLWWCLLASIIVIFAFFFLNSFAFAGRNEENFAPDHWKSRWFVLDGWLNIVYLINISYVAYLWRPTVNNRRFAMSDELAQDDDGFEIRSFGSSFDEERMSTDERPTNSAARELSPVPPKPVGTAPAHRESLDGETIFAVGEDGDRWSDDDESPRSSGEKKRLTSKND